MPRDLVADYEHAQGAALGWSETARATGDPRHYETALICARIAQERLEVLLTHRPGAMSDARMAHLRRQVAVEAAVTGSLALIQASQALLARLGPEPAALAAE